METEVNFNLDGISHEIWAAAQLMPDEGIVDGVSRVKAILEEGIEKLIGGLYDRQRA